MICVPQGAVSQDVVHITQMAVLLQIGSHAKSQTVIIGTIPKADVTALFQTGNVTISKIGLAAISQIATEAAIE